MRFSDILSRFDDVSEEADGGYLARCPAHSDSRPSLRIWRGDDNKVRLTCRAGCKTEAVIKAVDLPWSALFNATGEGSTVPKEKPIIAGTAQIAALRMWLDSLPIGDGAYAEERFGIDADTAEYLGLRFAEAKTFHSAEAFQSAVAAGDIPVFTSQGFARFPRLVVPLNGFDGVTRGVQGRDLSGKCPGRWLSLSNPQGQRWAQYGVFRGEAGYGVTLVTEGPGDGLTGVAVGYDVVMVRGAALVGNPDLLSELAEGMKGTQVIVCGDNDEAGLQFNRALAEGLKPYDITVYELRIPDYGPKTDLTDWRKADPLGFPLALHKAVKAAKAVSVGVAAEAEAVSAELSEATGADIVSTDQGHEAARILAGLMDRYGDTDAMNAHALVAWTDGRIKFAPGLGFYVWNGRTWETSEVKVRQEIHRMGAALMLAGKVKEARAFAMTTRINDLMTELRSVPTVYIKASDFDNRPDLLNFRNGTVDLRTGQLRPHDKADMMTYCLEVDYDPDAKCGRWEAFLEEIMPGMPEMPAYLQRLIGYGITGNTAEQCFAVLWGKGANGKSVLTDTLYAIFHAVAKTTPFETFEDKGNSGGIPNDIAMLRGARLVMAAEGESGKPMSEAVLKRVTGKDMIAARFLRQEFFEFKPSFLLMLATNHKPKFRGQDEGLWRRVKMIPFNRWFAPHERDYGLDKKLLAEAEGIAAWCVRGAVEWYRNGLEDPSVIKKASKEYRETSDALAGFFPGVLEVDDAEQMNGNDAFNAYLDWCEAENLPGKERWRRTTFYDAMEERGITRKKTNKGIALVGVRLASQEEKAGPGIFGKD
ncbi:phage/plasmid primase, P4 family [Streptomyces chattanoogensis]|uniref:phage/plasmid primase, P4 family n=1 Tax=Streptomyces chattanoogensis TaxID=66876 RepID=UPI003692E5E2